MGLVHTKTYVKGSHKMLQPKVAAQVEMYKTQSRLSSSSSTSYHTRQQTTVLQPISPNFKENLSDKYAIQFQTKQFSEERKSAFKQKKKETKPEIAIQNKGENKLETGIKGDIKVEKKKGDSISVMINEENYDELKFTPRKLQKNTMEFMFN